MAKTVTKPKPTTTAELPSLKKGDTFVNQDGSTGKVAFDYKTGKPLGEVAGASTEAETPAPTAPKISRTIYEDEPAIIKEQSVDAIQKSKLSEAQGEINNLNTYYESLKQEARVVGEGNLRSTDAISTLTGLAGSTEAGIQAKKTTDATKAELGKIDAEKQAATAAVLRQIRTSAVEEARNSRLEARQSEQDRIAFREKAQANAVEQLTLLSKGESGATLEGLRDTLSPKEYDYIIKNVGGEGMAKAILFESRPKNSIIGKVEFIGGQAVQQVARPDGSYAFEKIELPEGVLPNALVEKTDNGLLYSNDGGNTWKKVFGPGEGSTGGGGNSGIVGPDGKTLTYDDPTYTLTVIRNSKGGKALTGEQSKPITKAMQAISQVDDLARSLVGQQTGPIMGTIRSSNPWDVKAQVIKGQLQALIPNLARGVYGEVGVLTDQDIENYSKTLGNLRSVEEVNQALIAMTQKAAFNSIKINLESMAASGRNVSGFEPIFVSVQNNIESKIPKLATSAGSGSGMITIYSVATGKPASVPSDKVDAAIKSGLFRQ